MTNAIRTALATAEKISPRLAGELALPLFRKVGDPLPIRPDERATHDDARTETITVNGKRVITYQWGSEPRTVALVHGWRGRAAQFAALIRELRADGYSVVSFDAPANGASGGRRTDVRDYVDALHQLQRQHGAFEAVVAHSFGMLSAVNAVARGLDSRRVVGIAGVAEPDYLVTHFGRMLGLSEPSTAHLRTAFQRRVFPGDPSILHRFSGVLNPLPADVPLLLLHDRADVVVEPAQSDRLHEAHGERSRLIVTEGLGHRRILSADVTLDAVLGFLGGAEAEPVPGPRAAGSASAARHQPLQLGDVAGLQLLE